MPSKRMKKETKQFIESLFEFYMHSPSGQEPENRAALDAAWDDLETVALDREDSETRI